MNMKRSKYIDHTLLKADATQEDIERLCREAKDGDFASVCVNTYWVPLCAKLLAESDVKVCCVVGFPLGAMSTKAKAFETADARANGAQEIDMVLNIGELKAKQDAAVLADIRAVVEAADGAVVKVILENCLLSEEEIVRACHLCVQAGADFVKTSTGFSTSGATVEDVRRMKEAVAGKCLVKAAGGIRSAEDMDAMLEAGADRIGTSAGMALLGEH